MPAFVFTPQFIGVITTVALACGITFIDNDDIYDFIHSMSVVLGLDRLQEMNELMSSALTIGASGFISWNSTFKEKLVSLFDDYFTSSNKGELFGCVAGVPVYDSTNFLNIGVSFPVTSNDFMVGDLSFMGYSSGYKFIYYGEEMLRAKLEVSKVPDIQYSPKMFLLKYGSNVASMALSYVDPYGNGIERTWAGTMFNRGDVYFDSVGGVVSFPNQDTYDESNIKDGIYMPGNLGDIVGAPGGTIFGEGDNVYLPNQDIILPGVDNPSVDVGGSTDIPNVGNPDIPNVGNPSLPGVSQGVTDWIISLVVPSADYWNNKFNNYIDKIGSMLPIDIDYLKDMCVNGQPLPDFYINKNGQQMLVFSGKFANASANFIQVLFAGFSFVFLLLYNYSEVYKLIRGTRPFSSGGGE